MLIEQEEVIVQSLIKVQKTVQNVERVSYSNNLYFKQKFKETITYNIAISQKAISNYLAQQDLIKAKGSLAHTLWVTSKGSDKGVEEEENYSDKGEVGGAEHDELYNN